MTTFYYIYAYAAVKEATTHFLSFHFQQVNPLLFVTVFQTQKVATCPLCTQPLSTAKRLLLVITLQTKETCTYTKKFLFIFFRKEVVQRLISHSSFVRYAHKRSMKHAASQTFFHYSQIQDKDTNFAVFCVASEKLPHYYCYQFIEAVAEEYKKPENNNPKKIKSVLTQKIVSDTPC